MASFTVRMCPVCGSTALTSEAFCTLEQNDEGQWIPKFDQDVIDEAMDDPNLIVKCTNPMCTGPFEEELHTHVVLENDETIEGYYDRVHGTLDKSMHDEQYLKEREKWISSLEYTQWEGHLGDCYVLE